MPREKGKVSTFSHTLLGLMPFYLRPPSLSHPELPHTALVLQAEQSPGVCWQIPRTSKKHSLSQMLLAPRASPQASTELLWGIPEQSPPCPPEVLLCSLPEGLWGELTPQ